MKTHIKHILIVIIFWKLTACSSISGSKQVTTEYGTYKYYHHNKQGSATVIFESGLGDSMESWQKLLPLAEQNFSVFAYNRAGFDGSNSINKIRDSDTISLELASILTTLNISPPYILVGHSLGGIYMQTFLKRNPKDVKGLLLIDSIHPNNLQRCQAASGQFCEPGPIPFWAKPFYPNAVIGELKAWRSSLEQAQDSASLKEIPLSIIYAGQSPWGKEVDLNNWQKIQWRITLDNHAHLATLSPTSKLIQCQLCSHYIHQEKPDLVMSILNSFAK